MVLLVKDIKLLINLTWVSRIFFFVGLLRPAELLKTGNRLFSFADRRPSNIKGFNQVSRKQCSIKDPGSTPKNDNLLFEWEAIIIGRVVSSKQLPKSSESVYIGSILIRSSLLLSANCVFAIKSVWPHS